MEIEAAAKRIIVALDVSDERAALQLVERLRGRVGMFKIGLELFSSLGPGIVKRVVEAGGSVFLDGKFMDIPNTVASAAAAVTRLGVQMFNVHCFGGLKMMSAALETAKETACKLIAERPLVLGVTVLTSLDHSELRSQFGLTEPMSCIVTRLAELAVSANLDGVIASPMEIAAVRRVLPPGRLVVTPGVRPSWAARNDQKRVSTPGDAITAGADYIVIGRPITAPPEELGQPEDAATLIAEEIAESSVEQKQC